MDLRFQTVAIADDGWKIKSSLPAPLALCPRRTSRWSQNGQRCVCFSGEIAWKSVIRQGEKKTYTCIYIYMNIRIYKCICIYVFIYIYIYGQTILLFWVNNPKSIQNETVILWICHDMSTLQIVSSFSNTYQYLVKSFVNRLNIKMEPENLPNRKRSREDHFKREISMNTFGGDRHVLQSHTAQSGLHSWRRIQLLHNFQRCWFTGAR